MSEFKNLPSGWKVVRLGEICNVKQGLQIPISERFCENAQNRYFYITNEFLKEKSEVKYYIENPPEGTICFCDDILMTRTGNTGMVVTNVFGVFHNNFFKIAYDRQLIKKEYFVFLLTGPKIQNEILKRAGSSTIPDLNHGDFLSIKISIPPLDEQEKIAEILSTWDEAINLTINLIESKKQFKKALMQNLLTAKIRFPQFKDEWKIIRLKKISSRVTRRNQDNRCQNVLTISAQSGLINQTDFFNKQVASKDLSSYILLKKGDFAYNKSYSTGYSFGAFKRLKFYDEGVASPLYIYFKFNDDVCSDFFEFYFDAGQANRQIKDIVQEGARNHGLLNLSIDDFFNIKIRIPNLKEQQKIAEVLMACDDEINLLNLKLENLKKQKQGLMQKLLSGKVRVKYV
ncbi:restriction endonuclease subunit S [Campylobacter concisus]|uniref:restriction endonuclease subunit S n=1 Tax=Campylobacter concisus TaxID=199 RepID=UPI000CD8A2A9|nr:restriction endonuclease subunit S [Campylobacter concisus]